MKLQNNSVINVLLKTLFLAACLLSLSSFHPFQRLWSVADLKPFTEWFQINWQGQAVGWSKLQITKDQQHFQVIQKEHIEGRVRGQRMRFVNDSTWYFSAEAPYELIKGQATSQQPNLDMNTSFTNNGQLTIKQTRNDRINTFKEPKSDFSLIDVIKLRQFVEKQPSKGSSIQVASLDPHSLQQRSSEFQVIAQPKGRHQRYLLANLSSTSGGTSNSTSNLTGLGISRSGHILSQSRSQGMQLVASRGKPSFNPEMQQDLYSSTGIEVQGKLGDVEQIDALKLLLTTKTETDARDWFTVHAGAELNVNDKTQTLTIKPATKYKAKHNVLEQWRFYQPNDTLVSLSPELDPSSSKISQVEQLLTFTHNYLYYKPTPSSFSIVELIDNGYGDCTEYTQLLLALLNNAKIPARKVEGYIYLGDDEQRFGGHEWVEVLIDNQWLGVDPTWNLMHTTAGHLPIRLAKEKSASDLVFTVEKIHYK